MSRRTTKLAQSVLSTLHYSGVGELLRPLTGGKGVIFMLHSVSPQRRQAFEPNHILRVTPSFLETVITHVRESGFDCIALDDVPVRLASGDDAPPFAVFTLDDGYRDNREYAQPVFQRHGVPFTVYVPSAFATGAGDLWWLNLEAGIRALPAFEVVIDGQTRAFQCATLAEKERAFHAAYWMLRRVPEDAARAQAAELALRAGHDPREPGRRLLMSWDEVRTLAADPLVTIGGHTVGHFAVARLDTDRARDEIVTGAKRIEQELGRPCRHFSFPYGDELAAGPRDFELLREAGFVTAVTTRKGLLHAHHAGSLTALPRLSINGDFQEKRYLQALLSGAPFAMRDAVARLISRPATA